ncbi:MAG TPA: hypothetical protein VGE16_00500 [Albitalea sp.]
MPGWRDLRRIRRFVKRSSLESRIRMNFQQLRSVRETVRRGFNLTAVAAALRR